MTATKRRSTKPVVHTARPVPDLGPAPRVSKLTAHTRTLDNGLRVLAVRRPGVPLVELRLRIPFAGNAASHTPRATLLGESMLLGTAQRDGVALAEAIGALGADLGVGIDPDRLMISGNVLKTGLRQVLDLVAEIVTSANYPAGEVGGERARLVERISIARSQPGVVAHEARAKVLFGDHPYAKELPTAEDVAKVTPAQLRKLHADRVVPAGGVLVLVGDITPNRALDLVEKALAGWTTESAVHATPPVPAITPGPIVLVDRPGAVQSNLRLGGPALGREHEDYPALQLANLVYGGYFSSRLTKNIREDKGYTYSPRSGFDHATAATTFTVDADVATEVTAPALLETTYELARMATLPVGEDELTDARQYATGVLALSVATQAGLASTLAALAAIGLDLDWLRNHPARLAKVTVDDVLRVSRTYFSPAGLNTVVVGDAAVVADSLAALGSVSRA